MCRWLDHSFDPQTESREHHNPTQWSNKQRKDLTPHGRVAPSSMTCESFRGKLPEVAPKVYKTAPRPSISWFIHQAYLLIKASLYTTTKHTSTSTSNNQPTSCLLPLAPPPSPLSTASVVAPQAVSSTTSSLRSAAPITLPTLLAAQALRSRALPRACSARCGTGGHSRSLHFTTA